MVDERTVGCVIVALGDFYKSLGECAKNSFKKFHPEVELFYIDDESIKNYGYLQSYLPGQLSENKGITKFRIARDIMREEKLDKLIVLGADTITCSRLDEFMDRDDCDILGTSDYLFPAVGERVSGYSHHRSPPAGRRAHDDALGDLLPRRAAPLSSRKQRRGKPANKPLRQLSSLTQFHTGTRRHLNADVVCFNSLHALNLVVETSPLHLSHFEQGALNEVFFDDTNDITGELVEEAPVVEMLVFDDGSREAGDVNRPTWVGDAARPDVRCIGDHFFFGRPNEWNSRNVCYNVLSKSTLYLDTEDEYGNRHLNVSIVIPLSSHKPWKPFVEKFRVGGTNPLAAALREAGAELLNRDTPLPRLYTGDGRQIKVWHYCESFGSLVDTEAAELINKWIFEWFNEDTKTFFKDSCGCGDFFEKEYVF